RWAAMPTKTIICTHFRYRPALGFLRRYLEMGPAKKEMAPKTIRAEPMNNRPKTKNWITGSSSLLKRKPGKKAKKKMATLGLSRFMIKPLRNNRKEDLGVPPLPSRRMWSPL